MFVKDCHISLKFSLKCTNITTIMCLSKFSGKSCAKIHISLISIIIIIYFNVCYTYLHIYSQLCYFHLARAEASQHKSYFHKVWKHSRRYYLHNWVLKRSSHLNTRKNIKLISKFLKIQVLQISLSHSRNQQNITLK